MGAGVELASLGDCIEADGAGLEGLFEAGLHAFV